MKSPSPAALVLLLSVVCLVLSLRIRTLHGEIVELRHSMYECGKFFYEAGVLAEAYQELCHEKGLERSNLLFTCEQRICEQNGWSAPPEIGSLPEPGYVP